MERETRSSKERMEIEHGQYFEFIAEAEFYAVQESDDEETRNTKIQELERITKALSLCGNRDLDSKNFGDGDDPVTKRLNKSKLDELNTDYYHALAVIDEFMHDTLTNFIAFEAYMAHKHGGQLRDAKIFVHHFKIWIDEIKSGEPTPWIGGKDYTETLEMADTILAELKTNHEENAEHIKQLEESIEYLAHQGKFPENVYEIVTKNKRYGMFYKKVIDAMEYGIDPGDDADSREAKRAKIIELIREVNSGAKSKIAAVIAEEGSPYESEKVRSDQFFALSHMYACMYGSGNGIALSLAEKSVYSKYSKQKALFYLDTLESWVEGMIEGRTNIVRNHQNITEWLHEIEQDIDALNSDEWRKDNRVSKEFSEASVLRLQKVYDVMALYKDFPETIIVTNNLVEAKKLLTEAS